MLSDEMFNSLISNVTALACAAASVADETVLEDDTTAFQTDSVDPKMLEKIVEKLDTFTNKTSGDAPSLVDQMTIERAARFIDSRELYWPTFEKNV